MAAAARDFLWKNVQPSNGVTRASNSLHVLSSTHFPCWVMAIINGRAVYSREYLRVIYLENFLQLFFFSLHTTKKIRRKYTVNIYIYSQEVWIALPSSTTPGVLRLTEMAKRCRKKKRPVSVHFWMSKHIFTWYPPNKGNDGESFGIHTIGCTSSTKNNP